MAAEGLNLGRMLHPSEDIAGRPSFPYMIYSYKNVAIEKSMR